jgi:hypothetical protein
MRIDNYSAAPYQEYIRDRRDLNTLIVEPELALPGHEPLCFDGPNHRHAFANRSFFFPQTVNVPEVRVVLLENVVVAGPNFVFTEDGKALFGGSFARDAQELFLAPWREIDLKQISGDDYTCLNLRHIEEEFETAFCIAYHAPGNYHHILMDIMPRLGLLDRPEVRDFIRRESGQVEVPVLSNYDSHHIVTLLNSIGYTVPNLHRIPQGRAVRVKKLFVPNVLNNFSGWVSPEILAYFRRVMDHARIAEVEPILGPRIFSLRRDFPSDRRRIHNVDEVADVLMNYGFKEFFPERLTWREEMIAFHKDRKSVV